MKAKMTVQEAELIAVGQLPKGWEVVHAPRRAFEQVAVPGDRIGFWDLVFWFRRKKPRTAAGRIDWRAWWSLLTPAARVVIWLPYCAELSERLRGKGIVASTVMINAGKHGVKYTVARRKVGV